MMEANKKDLANEKRQARDQNDFRGIFKSNV